MERNGKKIAIIGGSSAGLFCALSLSRNKDLDITVFEKNDKLGKKLNATGNGHCNILPSSLEASDYNENEYMSGLFKSFSLEDLISFYKTDGIFLLNKNGLYYPYSFSAKSLNDYIYKLTSSRGVKYRLNERLLSYSSNPSITIKTTLGSYDFDKIVFACGGKSQPRLGSDGLLLDLFKQKGYKTREFFPTLCPVRTKEKTNSLDGKRHHGLVKLFKDNKLIYQEDGEVLFKNDGLSGIAIFNCSFYIGREDCSKYRIVIDLFPEIESFELEKMLSLSSSSGYLSILEKEVVEYLSSLLKKEGKVVNPASLAYLSKNVVFNPAKLYPFDSSQVSSGGISLINLNNDLSSKIENNVYFIGEMVDINGKCGGYNLAWCLISSLLVTKSI